MKDPGHRHNTRTQTEEEWEEEVLEEALGDVLREDGSIDFDRLRQRGEVVSLEELNPDSESDDE
jgi:hypothetical protein